MTLNKILLLLKKYGLKAFLHRLIFISRLKFTTLFNKIKYIIFSISGNIYINDNFEGFQIKYFSFNQRTWGRAVSAHKKEKITQQWIKSMHAEKGVLWDIGANIGVFSLLAAKYGVKVVCFEPLYSNYYVLCKNVELNPDIASLITVLPIAISDVSMIDELFTADTSAGVSGSSFGEAIDQYNNKLDYHYKNSILGMSGDDISSMLPNELAKPNYIKIDVDNIEHKIITGLGDVLKDPNLKSVLVEMDFEWIEKRNIIENILSNNGFTNLPEDRELTVETPDCTTYNYIFRRVVKSDD